MTRPFQRFSLAAAALVLTGACAWAQNKRGGADNPPNAPEAARAAIGVVAGNQVPPANAPLWGDARLDIPAQTQPLPQPDAGAQTFYVAPERANGGQSDSGVYAATANSGLTPDRPMPAVKALSDAPAGSVIVFRGGTYRGVGDITLNRKLSLQNFPGEKPWLLGSVRADAGAFIPAGDQFPSGTYVAAWMGDLVPELISR